MRDDRRRSIRRAGGLVQTPQHSAIRQLRITGAWSTSRYGTISRCYEFAHALYREVFYRRQATGRLESCSCASRNALEQLFSEHKNEVTSDNEPPRESWPGKFVVRIQWCYHLSSG